MQANPPDTSYFETPEREERLLLVTHLLENAREIVYLRGPAGAGKTLFARRVMARLADGFNFVWLDAAQEQDLAAVTARQLDVDDSAAPAWPDNLLFAMAERELLVVIDNADRLEVATMGQLAALHDHGASVLLVGRGGLVAGAARSPRIIDLPAFSEEQSAAFLCSRPSPAVSRVDGDMATALHSASHGRPGPLLDGLAALEGRTSEPDRPAAGSQAAVDRGGDPGNPRAAAAARPAAAGRSQEQAVAAAVAWVRGAGALPRRVGLIGGGLLAGALLLAALVFQDRINTWVAGAGDEVADPPPLAVAPVPRPDPASSGRVEPDSAAPEGTAPKSTAPGGTRPDVWPEDRIAATLAEPGIPDPTEEAPALPAPLPLPAAAAEPDSPSPDADIAGTVADGVAEDLLEAVMRDALAAAERQDSGPVAPVEKAPAVPAGDAGLPGGGAAAGSDAPSAAAETQVGDDAPNGPTATVVPVPAEDPAMAWLRSREPDRYTLQLIGSRERAAIDRFVERHGLRPPYAVFERALREAPWYSLVVGDYADRQSAVAARSDLPSALRDSDVWPRSFGSIQASLP
jgi:DamX protein